MTRVLSAIYCLSAIASIVSYSPSALALEPSEIYAKAKEFTVQIDGEGTGTGTIIKNSNNTYTVLTCWHVMHKPGSYQITTADGATHQVTKIENLPGVDLAIVTFSSSNTYPLAELGDSTTAEPQLDIHVVGYNAPFPGLTTREYLPESGEVRVRRETDEKGYEIVHSVIVTPGSSGGGIFDNEARLIGVNGEVFSEGNTGKAYGKGIPLEVYFTALDSLEVDSDIDTSADFLSAGYDKHKQQDYIGAIADYDQAIRLDPNDAGAYNNRGISYRKLGDYNSAIADYDQAIRLDPNYAGAYNNRGVSYEKLEDYDSAIADYDQAIRLDPNDALAYYNRGITYEKLGDYDSAIADFDQAIRLDPNYAAAYNNRGASYEKLEDYDSAIADYDQVIRLDPNYAEAYNNRGISYNNLRDYKGAIADYDQAIRLDPNYVNAYYNRGNSYYDLEDYESAIADYDQAIRLDPNDAFAYYNRGLSYKNIGNSSSAIRDFEQAAELYRQRGDTERYQKTINQIEQLR